MKVNRMVAEYRQKVDELLQGLPEEIHENVGAKLKFYKEKGFTEEELVNEAKHLIKLELLAYTETKREYLGLYNQKFSQRKTFWYIKEIIHREPLREKDFYSLARLDFDLNGLKALNDLSGDYSVGSESLRIVSNILEHGETTKWLRKKGLEVFVSIEGGDEFGVLIYGQDDLRNISNEIINKYFNEVYEAEVSHLIDFSNPDVRDRLELLDLASEVKEDFKFNISVSVGIAFLAEALNFTDLDENIGFAENVRNVRRKLFNIAHVRSLENKRLYKNILYETDPVQAALYARMNKEVIDLTRQLKEYKERLERSSNNE